MSILQDPVMQSILQQAKGDPSALAEHMRNPGVRSKIQKVSRSSSPGTTRTFELTPNFTAGGRRRDPHQIEEEELFVEEDLVLQEPRRTHSRAFRVIGQLSDTVYPTQVVSI